MPIRGPGRAARRRSARRSRGRPRARPASASANERLAAILATSADAIISKDLGGIIRTWNPGAERIFGYRAEEVLGKPMATIIPPDLMAEEHEILRRLREGKGYEQLDTIRLAKDGRQVHVSVSVWPIRDAEGRVVEAASILRDISERRAHASALQAALERYDLATKGAGVGTWEMRPKPNKLEENELEWSDFQATLFGLPAGAQPGLLTDATERVHPDDRERVRRAIQASLSQGSDFREEFRVTWPDGSVHWLTGRGRPVRDSSGRVVRMIGVNLDITARKNAEEAAVRAMSQLEERVAERTRELRESVEALERFTYTVAHDLRAPLRNVHQHVDRLLGKWPTMSRDEVQEYLNNIAEGARRADRLIADLLSYGQISQARVRLEPLDVGAAVAQVLRSLEGEMAERRASVSVAPSLPRAVGDDLLLRQALTHLVANALKFVAPERVPVVNIGADRRGARVIVWVEDNGIGIDPKYGEKVFGLFERLHPKDKYPGTGMGLAIVSRAVERMGGKVGFDSTPGEGSRFWIELKAAPEP